MQIIKDNFLLNLKNIINKNAKFQKVMLFFDKTVSNLNISKIYQEIKEICVFNKMEMENLNQQEIYNGYKLAIFCCSANSFKNLNLNLSEFINIFIPTDCGIMPFFLNENFILCNNNNYLFLTTNQVDVNVLFSIYFNKFYNYLKDIMFKQESNISFDFNISQITQLKILEMLQQENELEFIDVKFLNKFKMDYNNLPLIDFLLLNAFCVLINSLHENNVCLVDIYKSMKDEYKQIDKYYALANNCVFNQIVNLNFLCLKDVLNFSINKLKEFSFAIKLDNNVVKNLKEFCKNEDNLLNYLYLYNIFGE